MDARMKEKIDETLKEMSYYQIGIMIETLEEMNKKHKNEEIKDLINYLNEKFETKMKETYAQFTDYKDIWCGASIKFATKE